jgi:hypothetical protein
LELFGAARAYLIAKRHLHLLDDDQVRAECDLRVIDLGCRAPGALAVSGSQNASGHGFLFRLRGGSPGNI